MQGMAVLSCWVLGALQGAILILIPKMMLQGQLTALQLALPLSLGTLIFMAFCGQWGHLLDKRFSAKQSLLVVVKWVLLGFIISQLSFILLLQYSELTGTLLLFALCVSRVLHGIFCSAIIPSAQLSLSRGDIKGERLVWSSIATNVGRLTAPLLTFVPINNDYFSLWFILTVTVFALLIACFSHDSKQHLDPAFTAINHGKVIAPTPLFSFFSPRLLVIVCISALLLSLFSSQLQFSLGPLLLAQYNSATLATEMTAHLLFAASASALISLFIVYRLLSRYPAIFLMTISTALIVGCCLFVLQQQLMLAVILISAALSMAPAWYTALAMHASQFHKARTSAAVSQGHTLGNAFGGLVGGALLLLGEQSLLVSFILLTSCMLATWFAIYLQASRSTERNAVLDKLSSGSV